MEVDWEPDCGCPTFGKSFLASRPRKVIVNTVVIPDDWEGFQDWANVEIMQICCKDKLRKFSKLKNLVNCVVPREILSEVASLFNLEATF